jgi:hypothetical protein
LKPPPASGSAARLLDPRARDALRRLEWRLHHRRAESLTSGAQRSIFRGRGMEFDQVVKYVYGDDIRDVDWNVTARLGEPYRKIFVEEREVTVFVVVSDEPALQFGSGALSKRDVLLELAGFTMLLAALKGERVALLHRSPAGQRLLAPTRNRTRITGAVADLFAAPLPPPTGRVGHAAAPVLPAGVPRGALLVWLGEIPGDPPAADWLASRQRHDMIAIRVEDEWERALPSQERFMAYDPDAHEVVWMERSPAALAAHAAWRERRERLWASWWPDPAGRLVVGTAGDPLDTLVRFLRSRGRATRAGAARS